MQFSIVYVASFWPATWQNIAGNHRIHGQTKIFELSRSRGHFGINYRTLNPSLAAIKSFTFQQSEQHFQTFWLEVEVLCCLPTPFFRKHDGRKSRGRRSIGRHLPPPQRLLLCRPMITEAKTKIQKLSWKYTMLSLKFDGVTGEMRRVSIKYKIGLSVKCRVLVQASKLTKSSSV